MNLLGLFGFPQCVQQGITSVGRGDSFVKSIQRRPLGTVRDLFFVEHIGGLHDKPIRFQKLKGARSVSLVHRLRLQERTLRKLNSSGS